MSVVKKENIIKTILSSLIFPVLYFLLMVLFDQGYFLIWKALNPGATDAQANAQLMSVALFLLVGIIAAFFLITFIVFKIRHESLLKRIQWNPVTKKSVYVFAALAGLGLIFTAPLVVLLIPESWITNDAVNSATDGMNFLLTIGILGILAPIAEEIVFRGLMMTRLDKRAAPWLAVTLPVLGFAALHLGDSFGHMFSVLPLAVSAGLVFLWTRSIRVTMTIHIANNVIAFLIQELASAAEPAATHDTSGSILPNIIIGFIGLAITVFALAMIYMRKQKSIPNLNDTEGIQTV